MNRQHSLPRPWLAASVVLLSTGYSSAYQAPARSGLEELWTFLDRDGDARVDPYEGAEAFLLLAKEADANGDGALGADEVERMLRERREEENEERVAVFVELDRDQNQELERGELPLELVEGFGGLDLDGDGVVILEELLAAPALVPGIGSEAARFEVHGNTATMRGVIGPSTPARVLRLLLEEPQVDGIVMRDVPGSMDDDANLRAALMVRRAGLATHVPAAGEVASGGTDFFLAGVRRSAAAGARFGVHSWAGLGEEGRDVPRDDPEHERYLEYYRRVGVPDAFYWFTLEAAPADGIHWMTHGELDRFGVLTGEGGEELEEGRPDDELPPLRPWVPGVPTGPDPLGDIDTSAEPDGIVALPADVDPRVAEVFDRYTRVLAPSGAPIHILAQSGWRRDQIRRARAVLEHLLADVPGSRLGADKAPVANAMAARRATLVLFNDAPTMERAFDGPLGDVDLGFQDLRANECPVEGDPDYMLHDTRDAAFEEILHLVHDYGIRPVFPEYDEALHRANLAMRTAGAWDAWPPEEPENHRNEYFAAIYDNYLDLWTVPPTRYEGERIPAGELPPGTSHFGTYAHGSRDALRANDPVGYALLEDFLPAHLVYEARLPDDFTGEFSLRRDPQLRYTTKSAHLNAVRATGERPVLLRGNDRDNRLTAGRGDDRLEGWGGDDALDGGEGEDTALYRGPRSEYELRREGEQFFVRDTRAGRDGTDELQAIEVLQFADGVVDLREED